MVFAVSARAARRGAAGTGRFVSAAEISLSTWLFRADPDADAAVSARRAAVAPVVYAAFSDERAARRRARVFRRDPRRSGRSALPIGAVQRVESRMAQRLSARAAFQGRHGRGQPAALAVFARDGVARLCRRGAAGRRARHRDGRACDLLHLRVVPRALRGTRTRRAGRSDGKAAALSRRRNALACAVAARAGNAVAHHVFRASYRLSPHAPELFPAARLSHHTARRAAGLRHGHGARAVGGLHAAVRLPAQGHRAPRALPLHAHHAQHARAQASLRAGGAAAGRVAFCDVPRLLHIRRGRDGTLPFLLLLFAQIRNAKAEAAA